MRPSSSPRLSHASAFASTSTDASFDASGLSASSPEAISYATALSAIIACPYKLRSGEEARALFKVRPSCPLSLLDAAHASILQVGEKLAIKVDEFLETGRVKEAGASFALVLSLSSPSSRPSFLLMLDRQQMT